MDDKGKSDDLSKTTNEESLYRVSKFLAKAAVGVVAPIGLSAIATELFDLVVSDPAVKRRDRFLMDLARRLDSLEAEGKLSLSDLLENEEAAALLFRATQAAMRSSGERKFQAIRETALNGILSAAAREGSPAQVVVGLLDRITEYHVILLSWENRGHRHYTLGDLRSEQGEQARRSLFYGQPVFVDKAQLKSPVAIFSYVDWGLYVERNEYDAFKLAHADLVATGLLKPILGKEEYLEGRVVKRRTTPEAIGYEVSDLGRIVCDLIEGDGGGSI